MNLFKKAMLAVVTMILAVVTIVVPANRTTEVEAANTDNSKEKWSAIGTINGSSWNKDFPLEYNAETDRYELQIALNANNEFKVRLNNSWSTAIGYGGNTGAGISTYLSNSGGNFKVKTTGNYVIWVKDDNVRKYTDNSYGFGIEKAATVVYHTITFYSQDGSILDTEEVIEGSALDFRFEEIEGFALEGWYTDLALTNKAVKGSKIMTDLKLYPKYVPAEDYVVRFDDNGTLGDSVYAYVWRDSTDGGNNTWPGVKLEKDATGLYALAIDASQTYTKIIFNAGDGKPQTVDLDLAEGTYVIGAIDSEGHYAATLHETPEVTAVIGWQTGVKGEAKALRIVVALTGVTAANIAYLHDEIQISVSYNGEPYVHTVEALFTGVASLGEGEVPAADLYAVLTIEGIPSGEFAIEALIGGEVVATATANA